MSTLSNVYSSFLCIVGMKIQAFTGTEMNKRCIAFFRRKKAPFLRCLKSDILFIIERAFAGEELYRAFDRILRFAPREIVEAVVEFFTEKRNVVLK